MNRVNQCVYVIIFRELKGGYGWCLSVLVDLIIAVGGSFSKFVFMFGF